MARPLRIEYAGALYHITARGNARQDIYLNEIDRHKFLATLQRACERYQWLCHAYCLMSNHYHLLIETRAPTLSRGLKYINGTYSQIFNRTHHRVGHMFQGRYKAILVDKDTYLLELSRYIVLNPVRKRMVIRVDDWPWSSYRATAGQVEAHGYLTTDWILGNFGRTRRAAQEKYTSFVQAGKEQPSPWKSLKNQIYLGPDTFIDEVQCKLDPEQSLIDIPGLQRLGPVKPLSYYQDKYRDRNRAMTEAYRSGHYTLVEVGDGFGVSYATVSRAVKAYECKM